MTGKYYPKELKEEIVKKTKANMILYKTILILEDNLKVLSKILEKLAILEEDQPYEFSPIILTNYIQVQELINTKPNINIDIVLLDRDCKLDGSFHILDLDFIGVDKIISISSITEFNEKAKKRGVKRIIEKDLKDIDTFSDKVVKEIADMIGKTKLTDTKSHYYIKP